MLARNEKKSLLRVLVAGSCSVMITIAAMTAVVSAETITITFQSTNASAGAGATNSSSTRLHAVSSHTTSSSETCLYTTQLASDPVLRNEYANKIALSKWGLSEESDQEIYESNIAVGNAFAARLAGDAGSVDRFSNECLACHDGVMAQNFKIRVKNNPENRVMSLEDIIGGHPVGMEYDRYLSGSKGKEYRHDVTFNSEVIFAEGKIGCLTCHNPLNTAKGHLVMNNEKSELCFSCHRK